MIILPRQPRDKHSESTQKERPGCSCSARRVSSLSSSGQTLTVQLLLAPREEIETAVLSPAGDVLRTMCIAKGTGLAVAYGDRDVAMTLTCEGAYCRCI